MLKRALEARAANPEAIDRMTFPELIRTASEKELVASDWPIWRTWREMRNISCHSYDEAKAVQVIEAIPDFLKEISALSNKLS